MRMEVDLPDIGGFEYTGEFRTPKPGEHYLNLDTDRVLYCEGLNRAKSFIMKRCRPRKDVGDRYWAVDVEGDILSFTEEYSRFDVSLYSFGNYWGSHEDAQMALERIKETMLNLHKELGR
jgi:hypothetical protein